MATDALYEGGYGVSLTKRRQKWRKAAVKGTSRQQRFAMKRMMRREVLEMREGATA